MAPWAQEAAVSSAHLDIEPAFGLKEEKLPEKYTRTEIDLMLTYAKYFIIKSSNGDNIELSRKYSEWATTKSNEVVDC